MTPKRELYSRALDHVEAHPEWTNPSIEITERADGSGRWQATIVLVSPEGDEITDIIIAPASEDAPEWAPRGWEIESTDALPRSFR